MTTGRINQVTTLYTPVQRIFPAVYKAPQRIKGAFSGESTMCWVRLLPRTHPWNDTANESTVSRPPVSIAIFPGYTPTINVALTPRPRSQSNAFASIANTPSGLQPTIDGDETFGAR